MPFVQKHVVVTYAQEMQFLLEEYMLEIRDITSYTVLVGSIRNKISQCLETEDLRGGDTLFSQILVTVLFSLGAVLPGHFLFCTRKRWKLLCL